MTTQILKASLIVTTFLLPKAQDKSFFLEGICIDPDLTKVASDQSIMLCDGSLASGLLDLSSLTSGKIRAGVVIAGTLGTLAECSTNFSTNCITNSSFKGISPTNLNAANIKNGVSIGGITGNYPSSSSPLIGSSGLIADLSANETTRNAQLASSTVFEWFKSDGSRGETSGSNDLAAANIKLGVTILGIHGEMDDSPPDPWDLRYGISTGGVTGQLKTNCRNMVSALYDKADGLSTGISGVNDPFSTIKAYAEVYPNINPWGSDQYLCGYVNVAEGERTWERIVTTPSTSAEFSVFKDKMSGQLWTRGESTGEKYWDEAEGGGGAGTGAMEYCHNLNHGGINAWRLPTQKELWAAYAHGIFSAAWMIGNDGNNLGDVHSYWQGFWSSTSRSGDGTNAWYLIVRDATGDFMPKTSLKKVLCISP